MKKSVIIGFAVFVFAAIGWGQSVGGDIRTPGMKLLSGFSIKAGWQPGLPFTETWVGGVGFDFGLSPNIALGLDILPSFFSDSEIQLTVVPVLGLAAVKVGLKILRSVTLFVGAGGGFEASFISGTYSNKTYTHFEAKPALQGLFGVEAALGGTGLFLEGKYLQVIDANVTPNSWQLLLLGGIRF